MHKLELALVDFFKVTLGTEWRSKRFLLAVSGGADSMAMAHALLQVVPSEQIVLAHFNHQTRGKESDRDAKFVRTWAKTRVLELREGLYHGKQHSERALREARWSYLKETLKERTCDVCLTAHHADDQLETLLMRLIRGTGLTGLGGIPPQNGRILRPWLKISRNAIRAYTREKKVTFREDSTNAKPDYFRNAIRKSLVPVLVDLSQRHGGSEALLLRTSGLIDEVRETIQKQNRRTRKLATKIVHESPFWHRFELSQFASLPRADQENLLRYLFLLELPEVPSRLKTREAREWILKGKGKFTGPHRMQLEKSLGHVYLMKVATPPPAPKDLSWLAMGDEFVQTELGLRIKLLSPQKAVVRFYRAGDTNGTKKLKRLFWERGVPAPERAYQPVLQIYDSPNVQWLLADNASHVLAKQIDFPFTVLLKRTSH